MYKLLLIAIMPSIILGYYVYIKDKEEKESLILLTKLFISGILACFLSILLTYVLNFLTNIDIFEINYHSINGGIIQTSCMVFPKFPKAQSNVFAYIAIENILV